ncbi:hypothetical protein MLD38_005136 [Melastoma candidum]|uniref:Uncharacterized protein n=1 Tax=Melastoma candidum TaxID=119954 RepID=A0ACB9S9G3_9MYRT|nr:hypothetical protein MLD38_005136 [Melastoma candidum]
MANVAVATEWQLLCNRYYRKPLLYQMRWRHIDLSRNKVAAAPFGSPVAIILDDSKIVQLYSESALRKLRIFSSSGTLLAETVWKNPGGRLIGMYWTDDLNLACLVQDGTVYRYNIRAELVEPNVSFGKECFEQNVVECIIWSNSAACVTEGGMVFCLVDFGDPQPSKLAELDLELEGDVLCFAVVEPKYVMSGSVEVLLGVAEGGIVVVEEDSVQRVKDIGGEPLGVVSKLSVSGDGKWLAAFTGDGQLLVMPADFSEIKFSCNCELCLQSR